MFSSSASNSNSSFATVFKPKSNSFSSSRDSEWLMLDICREYQRGECIRDEYSCRYAHPPKNVESQSGRVICCFDYLKSKCHRRNPPCKYLHPPNHLKEQLLQKGKTNLMMKNLQLSFVPNCAPANLSRPQSAIPYNLKSIPIASHANLDRSQNFNNAIQLPLPNVPFASSPVSYVMIPSMESHNVSNIQFTHMGFDTVIVDSDCKLSANKTSFRNSLQSSGSDSNTLSPTLINGPITPYQSFQQQYSFTRSYCIPYQPILMKNWPNYTYATVLY